MLNTLIIVESSTKAKKIQKFLGTAYNVRASFGHLNKITDIDEDFNPTYNSIKEKVKTIKDLKYNARYAKEIILASDPDREGEAIAYHLAILLNLDPLKTKRIVFNNITKKAVLHALANPRTIDINLFNAQQARAVLDRLVGYELSPLLWKYIDNYLSAGRVQSVALKLITEIKPIKSEKYYETIAKFKEIEKAILHPHLKMEPVEKLKEFANTEFKIESLNTNEKIQYPPPPFTTSSLQREAGQKFYFSAKVIMNIAQKLYQNGHITYHRTDSTELSSEFINTAKEYIKNKYTETYSNPRNYKTNNETAQEAHEAIRPTKLDSEPTLQPPEYKLYNLIKQRALASQMSARKYDYTEIDITGGFKAKQDYTLFDGYMILYNHKNVKNDYRKLEKGQKLVLKEIISKEEETDSIKYYSEPSLNKKMEQLGIGRPSTIASIMDKLQERNYVTRETRKYERDQKIYRLINKSITVNTKQITKIEKMKLYPTELGNKVSTFLQKHFTEILDYSFTAQIEKELDEVMKGVEWKTAVSKFYNKFHPTVLKLKSVKIQKPDKTKRYLGKIDNKEVYVRRGRYGNMAEIGDKNISLKGYVLSKISLKQIEELLKYPKDLGEGILLRKGKYGFYINYNNKNYKAFEKITLKQAKKIIN